MHKNIAEPDIVHPVDSDKNKALRKADQLSSYSEITGGKKVDTIEGRRMDCNY
ncbi:8354_t:CDS:2 [Funneliformis mosseae]|uniref:8354_t:CDS:1 n=1 Tax=Funneliformis mosseae TaxID=27381 RepID=A0A9N8YNT4_FUNMO|nr:8354_t:CDS:2 [Funneliformis mosseae]